MWKLDLFTFLAVSRKGSSCVCVFTHLCGEHYGYCWVMALFPDMLVTDWPFLCLLDSELMSFPVDRATAPLLGSRLSFWVDEMGRCLIPLHKALNKPSYSPSHLSGCFQRELYVGCMRACLLISVECIYSSEVDTRYLPRVSYWVWSSLFRSGWLSIEAPESSCFCTPALEL